jgi:hypothetical protein
MRALSLKLVLAISSIRFLSVLLGVIFLRERLRPAQWVPVALAALGCDLPNCCIWPFTLDCPDTVLLPSASMVS